MKNETKEQQYQANQPYFKMLSEMIRIFGSEELEHLIDQPIDVEQEAPMKNVA